MTTPGRSPIGVLLPGWASAERGDADVLAETCRAVVHADRLGFGTAWFTEQHAPMFGAISGRIAAPQLLVAHLAGMTERIGLGTAVRLVAGADPERIAEELVTLDLLTGGRVRYGIGAGSAGEEGGPGPREVRRAAFRRTAGQVVHLLRSGGIGHDLGLCIPDLSSTLLVASADPRSVQLAARNGLGFFVGMFGGARHRQLVAGFRADGGTGQVRASRLVYVGEDDHEARRTAASAADHFWPRFTPPTPGWRKRVAEDPGPWSLDDVRAELGWIVGGPSTVRSALARYVEDCGLDGLDICFDVPGLSAEAGERSMDLFAREVLPGLEPVLGRRPVLAG
ncbi:LLM class flavin-dependent oxidoreductase [Pseudonocardia spinosispora]|uniref:LLM class flavin-dependent oxidoreductase n=1 Tax=Pseudonocardia spinosispora TaxID=103441 RepID=UPI0004906A1A|nr:LLM class flavin-dependent oxidoreductase [Pseudonocardia spinosispora]